MIVRKFVRELWIDVLRMNRFAFLVFNSVKFIKEHNTIIAHYRANAIKGSYTDCDEGWVQC